MGVDTRPLPWIIGFVALLAVMVGCAVSPGSRRSTGRTTGAPASKAVTIAPGPRLDHSIHAEDMDCGDCHEMDAATGQPGMPNLEFCVECHEDVDEEKPPEEMVKNLFFGEDEQPKWQRALEPYADEVKWNHAAHGKLECATCHGTMIAEGGRVAQRLFGMDQCMQCHQQWTAPNECSSCHAELSTRTPPASHTGRYLRQHGRDVYQGDRELANNRCEICHKNETCDACHQLEKPISHRQLWDEQHGQVFKTGSRVEQARCKTCHHQPSFCENCHLTEQPRNHTHLFRTRTHGVMASIDRTSCSVCHQTDFCVRCHEDTEPISHRAQFATGRNTHCVNCHFPVQAEPNCSVCHKTTPTHQTAPGLPGTHTPGSNCRICHSSVGGGGAPPLRHIDNGMNCETCHK